MEALETPWTQYVNWTYIRRSEDVLDVFWTSYIRSIYVLCPEGHFQKYSFIYLKARLSIEIIYYLFCFSDLQSYTYCARKFIHVVVFICFSWEWLIILTSNVAASIFTNRESKQKNITTCELLFYTILWNPNDARVLKYRVHSKVQHYFSLQCLLYFWWVFKRIKMFKSITVFFLPGLSFTWMGYLQMQMNE